MTENEQWQWQPRYFCVQHDIVIGGQTYDGIGNIALLQAEKYMPVHVRHTLADWRLAESSGAPVNTGYLRISAFRHSAN